MRKLFNTLAASFAAILFVASPALATNGHQLIGIGAYSVGMGGATTAAPYDTTTAVTNPAGMAVIDTRADFSFEAFMPSRTADFTASGGESNQGGSPMYLVPAVGWVGPINEAKDLVFGGGMFVTSGMGVDYDTISSVPFGAQGGDFTPWKANIYSQYQFWKLAPTLAKKIDNNLTVGISLDVDYQQLAVKEKFFDTKSSSYFGLDLSRAVGSMGFGVTLGALYKVNDMIQVGASYISEQSFSDMDFRLSQGDVMFPTGTGTYLMSGNGTYKLGMNFPQQVIIGLAVAPMSNLKVTADYKWINFSQTHNKINLKGSFAEVSSAGQAVGSASALPLNFGWDDQSVIAVGVEYGVNEMLKLRAGYNYASSPIKEEDVFNNLAFPAISESHITLGAGLNLSKNWELALAYARAFKKEITGKNDMMGSSSGAKIALEGQSVLLGISYNYGK